MNLPTAAFSAHSHVRNNMLPYLALVALAASNVSLPMPQNPKATVLPSAFVPEAELYQYKRTETMVRHVTAEESRVLRLAILASSEIVDEGDLVNL